MVKIIRVMGGCGVSVVLCQLALAQAGPAKLPVTFGGFVDTYYGYDFNNPPDHQRLYGTAIPTTINRSNEFNVNLAYLEAKVAADRVRGRVAFQVGNSVQGNYLGEPRLGAVNGPSLVQHIQEAYAGYRINDRLWVDAGIMLSYIGSESWVSKDDWNYTRSLGADFTPYYQSGVRATYQWSDVVIAQLNVMNGWQNISENNGNKAIGVQVVVTPNSIYSLTYNNFLGTETGNQLRFFNEIYGKVAVTEALQLLATYDLGMQRDPSDTVNQYWINYNLQARYQLTPSFSVAARAEEYVDPNQVIVTTLTPNGFQTYGTSLNGDWTLSPGLLWRNEIRGLWSKDPVFPGSGSEANTDELVVTSLSLAF